MKFSYNVVEGRFAHTLPCDYQRPEDMAILATEDYFYERNKGSLYDLPFTVVLYDISNHDKIRVLGRFRIQTDGSKSNLIAVSIP
jgi:hypothetical protein